MSGCREPETFNEEVDMDVGPQLALDGIGFVESPVRNFDGSITFVDLYGGNVTSYDPEANVAVEVAYVGGSPNAAIPTRSGGMLITQNGGTVGSWRSANQREPSIQFLRPDGGVDYLVTQVDGVKLKAPNDLVFGPDNLLYFTDSGSDFMPGVEPETGRIFMVAPDGGGEVLTEVGGVFPNGIAFDAKAGLVWSESYTRAIRRMDIKTGVVDTLCVFEDPLAVPDGIAIDEDGNIFVAATSAGGVCVVGQDGDEQFISVGRMPTNCALIDTWLYVTDAGQLEMSSTPNTRSGALWRIPTVRRGLAVYDGGDGW